MANDDTPSDETEPGILEFVADMKKYQSLCTARGRDEELKEVITFIRSRGKEMHLTNLFDIAKMLEEHQHRK
jgi:hypothetical protein